jgi:hypothetical protein
MRTRWFRVPVVPTANPRWLTAAANQPILAPDERSLQVDLVCPDVTAPFGAATDCITNISERKFPTGTGDRHNRGINHLPTTRPDGIAIRHTWFCDPHGRRLLQKTRLARSNQAFSSAVNGFTARFGVALRCSKLVGGGAARLTRPRCVLLLSLLARAAEVEPKTSKAARAIPVLQSILVLLVQSAFMIIVSSG